MKEMHQDAPALPAHEDSFNLQKRLGHIRDTGIPQFLESRQNLMSALNSSRDFFVFPLSPSHDFGLTLKRHKQEINLKSCLQLTKTKYSKIFKSHSNIPDALQPSLTRDWRVKQTPKD